MCQILVCLGAEPEDLDVGAQGVHHFGVGLGDKLDQAAAADRPVGKTHPPAELLVGDHVDAGAVGAADLEGDAIGRLAVERGQDALATRHLRSP